MFKFISSYTNNARLRILEPTNCEVKQLLVGKDYIECDDFVWGFIDADALDNKASCKVWEQNNYKLCAAYWFIWHNIELFPEAKRRDDGIEISTPDCKSKVLIDNIHYKEYTISVMREGKYIVVITDNSGEGYLIDLTKIKHTGSTSFYLVYNGDFTFENVVVSNIQADGVMLSIDLSILLFISIDLEQKICECKAGYFDDSFFFKKRPITDAIFGNSSLKSSD